MAAGIIVATEATSTVLGGVRNQIQPDARREDIQKWRQRLPPKPAGTAAGATAAALAAGERLRLPSSRHDYRQPDLLFLSVQVFSMLLGPCSGNVHQAGRAQMDMV
ncbi:hypothetical protein V5799_019544 [Amblyomma americanum]|uniref:Secreted protein n=1 Tax=Amblyomma americanum TaxID=6943 RepID=A0AAQ4EWH2_AMBAM